MVAIEKAAMQHRPSCRYVSLERSERTGGHLWEERVVEVPGAKLRYLVSEDGRPLSASRNAAEVNRLHQIAADPVRFLTQEQARRDDEQRAMLIFSMLPRAFLFDWLPSDHQWLRVGFRPNPSYHPHSYEERILHAMSGMMMIERGDLRLHELEGKLSDDVSFGFGLLAVIHRGSYFSITRNQAAPGVWKTTAVQAHIDGRAMLFKTIARSQDTEHSQFQIYPASPSIPSAVQRLLN